MSIYTVLIFENPDTFTRTTEKSDLDMSDFSKSKLNEGYSYCWILCNLLFLKKGNFVINILKALDDNEKELYNKVEAELFGILW